MINIKDYVPKFIQEQRRLKAEAESEQLTEDKQREEAKFMEVDDINSLADYDRDFE